MPAKPKVKQGKRGRKLVRKSTVGRPSTYREEYAAQAKELTERGLTHWEIAQFLGISRGTLYAWKGSIAEFSDAISKHNESSNDRVEVSLYERAVGYSYESEKVFQFQGDVIRAKTVEHIPPDPGAAMMWLKNRRADGWKDKSSVDQTVTVGFTEQFETFIRRLDQAPARELLIESKAVEVIGDE
tara:strand:- start:235 stop:789 length:555 start_codon:yes stop_codon:yes gene_type:complete